VGMHLISLILLLYTQCYYVQTFIGKKEREQSKATGKWSNTKAVYSRRI